MIFTKTDISLLRFSQILVTSYYFQMIYRPDKTLKEIFTLAKKKKITLTTYRYSAFLLSLDVGIKRKEKRKKKKREMMFAQCF